MSYFENLKLEAMLSMNNEVSVLPLLEQVDDGRRGLKVQRKGQNELGRSKLHIIRPCCAALKVK